MLEIGPPNALDYLRGLGRLDRRVAARAELLAWGVSNAVLRITPDTGEPFVIKQSRGQLRTKAAWFSRLDRIWRETEVMQLVQPLLPPGVVPRVLFEDRQNFLFGMEAAPAAHDVWKQLLLDGEADSTIASRLGEYLATLHRETALRPDLAERFGDRQVFVELRVDPFYRRLAEAAPEVACHLERLINDMYSTVVCLVHADFSPKNVLIAQGQIVLVDFETGHLGDPAFDLGFFLSHLLLKTVLHADRFAEYAGLTTAFWQSYLAGVGSLTRCPQLAPHEIVRRTTGHLAGCMWARIDATSKIDYLNESQQEVVRQFCRGLFDDPPADWPLILDRLAKVI
jgi:aminoglycoside phosphotransferase (APT) family kinase protein